MDDAGPVTRQHCSSTPNFCLRCGPEKINFTTGPEASSLPRAAIACNVLLGVPYSVRLGRLTGRDRGCYVALMILGLLLFVPTVLLASWWPLGGDAEASIPVRSLP